MTTRELMQVPMGTGSTAAEVYSGIARMAGVLWCARVRAREGRRADTAVVVVHPSSNFLGHYALESWAALGVDAIAMTTRYLGNDSVLLLENCVLDVGSVVRHLKREGYERVVLVGNSGGGGLVCLYQSQAVKPTITASPGGGGPDLTTAELIPADALIMLMAHPGRANLLVEWLDPAIRDEHDPFDRDPGLDMFDPRHAVPYDRDWLAAYRAAQVARGERITEWVLDRLAALDSQDGQDGRDGPADLPFSVHGTCADPRHLDLTIDASDRAIGTLWGPARAANMQPTTLGHLTSLRSWLSQWSLRT
ncbi:alpha/beta fold hydrolase, partial [Nocardia aurea]|uniref:alpha/beta hydrolase n=1 Tax=Nocardia aurea TaxID=2144174 RepID=UPI000D68662D